jgi:hypothetical protein
LDGYKVTNAHRVKVKVVADGHASAPPSGAAAAAPPAGAYTRICCKTVHIRRLLRYFDKVKKYQSFQRDCFSAVS